MHNVVCRRCGFVYANPRLDRSSLDDFYQSHIYPQFVGTDGRFTQRLLDSSTKQANDTYRFFVERAGLDMDGKHVLEVGCGLGDFLVLARSAGADVLGVEMDGLYADFAEQDRGVPVLRHHIERHTFDRQFDAIAMFHVLEHLEDPGAMLSSIRSLLTPAGSLLIEVPNLMGPWKVPPGEFFRLEHLSNFSPNTLREILHRSGFHIVRQDDDPFLLRVLARPAEPASPDLPSLAGEYRRVRWHVLKWRLRGQLFRPYYALRRALTATRHAERP